MEDKNHLMKIGEREREINREIKILRQNIARAGNELHRRQQKRKATKKEKNILRDF